ncbi:DNA repair protein complementing XP-C cells homolog [Cylas formicarius]|uniref:DNA repair protein complementing XP-C cells homolog n=1 Tax=Cylas formicarius TaxID=197179 RepID=UPI002958D1A8|nr:DNA repair protein complementing XP-C cells homolog [Cylas formicarius]
MKRTRSSIKRYVESSDSEDDPPSKKLISPQAPKAEKNTESSSSESDIENYLQRPDKLDLNSEFFNSRKNDVPDFNKIENEIFAGITRLSESDSSSEGEKNYSNVMLAETSSKSFSKKLETNSNKRKLSTSVVEPNLDALKPIKNECDVLEPTSKLTFDQFKNYTRKIEEAKKIVEKYNARHRTEEKKIDIINILTAGEMKPVEGLSIEPGDLHSSDFDSTDEEAENWEEISPNKLLKSQDLIPKKNVEITIGMPDVVRKKKGIDLLAVMKRRLNRIRKENQILVHKVHLLCWIAHGNYVNCQINDTQVLGLALSLLPSEQCYPSDRTDLSYLEQIVQWYKRTVRCIEKPQEDVPLVGLLQQQISKKEANSNKMLVLIFVAVLRSLGIQCRLIISLQVEPLRPPANELHSLTSKVGGQCRGGDKKPVHSQSNKELLKTVEPSTSTKSKEIKNTNIKTQKGDKKIKEKIVEGAKGVTTKTKLGEPKSEGKNVSAKLRTCRRAKNTSISTSTPRKNLENCNPSKQKSKAMQEKDVKLKHSSKSVKKTQISRSSMREEKLTTRSTSTTSHKSDKKSTQKAVTHNIKRKEIDSSKLKSGTTNSDILKTGPRFADAPKRDRTIKTAASVSKKSIPKVKIQQVDGANCSSSSEEFIIPQLDGAGDKKNKRPNLNKLKGDTKISDKILKRDDTDSEFVANLQRNTKHKDKKSPNLGKLSECKKNVLSKQVDVRNDIIDLIKGRIKEQKHTDQRKKVKKTTKESSDSDSDYLPEVVIKKQVDSEDDFKPKSKVKTRIPGKMTLIRMEDEKKKRTGNDYWVEVFLESEEKWISADLVYGQVHCVKEVYQRATHPVSYVLAWNNDNTLKDVTQRYCQNYNTVTRKLRIDSKWWNESLNPFVGKSTARDLEEDEDLARQQLDQPLPKSIAEYKNHPLYVLKRHLLKFEALYPPDTPTLGFIRGEAVYPRGCVYTLHSRDIWLKQAKVVKLGEQPYKIVKARPKYDKLSNKMITDQMLEIFGLWQTEDYVPPTAENGVVPRNAFGNVDLFKPCMLPFGTVHLKLPGLAKVAKKMNVDCAPAVVGFEFHSGWSVPTIDGFVVCKEYEEEVVAAWEKEQAEMIRREQEKTDNRVYGNWRRLIKGLLIRERLKAKYDFGTPSVSGTTKEIKKKAKAPTYCTKRT